MRRSFDDAVLVVEGDDPGNSIVFGCKGKRFDRRGQSRAKAIIAAPRAMRLPCSKSAIVRG